MTNQQLIDILRNARTRGVADVYATLSCKVQGVKKVRLTNLDGTINGNPHDILVESQSGKKVLGHIYLGSKKRLPDTDGWESLIAEISN